MPPAPSRSAAWFLALVAWAGASFGSEPWQSELYGPGWQATPPLSFDSDKILQDFSFAGYRRGEEPLPKNPPGATYDVVDFGADPTGAVDSTDAIQAAIDAAGTAGGGVVWMPPGTYLVRPQPSTDACLHIRNSGVVLRGAGADRTFLLNTETVMRQQVIVSASGPGGAAWTSAEGTATPLAADLPGPTTVLPVGNASLFVPGDTVVVRADPGDDWALEHNEPGWVGVTPGSFGRLLYLREVVAVDLAANTLVVDIPTRYALKRRDNARVYKKSTLLREVGLEDFSIGNVQHPGSSGWGETDHNQSGTPAYEVHGHYAIRMRFVQDGWIRQVDSFRPAGNTTTCHLLNNGILLTSSARITVRDCHFQRPQYGGGGGAGYMFRLSNSGDCLVQDCIAEFSRHGFVFSQMASSGNVLHACLDKTTGKQTGASGNENTSGRGSDHHMHFSHSNLVDVCVAEDSWFEARYRPFGSSPLHNLTAAHCVFWNTEGRPSGRSYVVHSQQSRYGYVIGTRGAVSAVRTDGSSTAKTDPVDHVEGVGLGATLQPFSLFREQRRRRLGLPRVSPISARTVFFPGKSASVFPEVDFGGSSSVPADAAAVWTRLDGPGVVDLRAASALGVEAAFSSPGIHTLRLTVGRHGSLEDDFAASATALVEIVPPGRDETLLPAAADAFVQRGDPDKNFNTGSLWMKYVGPTGTVNREIFMRFDLSSLAGRVIEGASLEFYATDVATSATAETRLVEDDSWSEDGITWNTRPAAGALLQSWALSDEGLLRVELDAAAIAGAAGDGLLSLRHSIASQSDNGPIFQFASRENADASRRPRLRVRHREDWPAYADWIAGFPSLPAGDRDPEDDPDGDGISNLEEYARRLSPHLAEKTRPSLVAEAGPDAPASLRFPGAAGMPPGVQPLVEHSASLEPALWSPVAGGTFEAAGPDLLWTPPAELREGRGGFFRLRLVRDR